MKKQITILVLLLFSVIPAFTQWQVQSYNPAYINSYFFNGTSTGWTAAVNGKIRKTTNGGITWENQTTNTNTTLWCISFLNQQTGWAGGESGVILATTNGGTTWNPQVSGTTNTIYEINFLNSSTGIAGIGLSKVLRTTNGGVNWVTVTPPGGVSNTINVLMRSASISYCSVGTGFYKSTDAGASWVSLANLPNFVYDMTFIDDNTGYICTNAGNVQKTTNGGLNWVTYATGNSNALHSIEFLNANTGFTAGADGVIYRSTNAGVNWSSIQTFEQNLMDISIFGSNQLFICGQSGQTAYSASGAGSWIVTSQGQRALIYDINFINPQNGWIANYRSNILFTTNGGANWNVNAVSGMENITNVYFLNNSTGFITGVSGGDGSSINTIGKTTNGGSSWQNTMFNEGTALSMQFVNNNDGFLLAYEQPDYRIYKTTNTGANWNPTFSTGSVMNDAYFTTQLNGWMCGNNGVVLKTTNGGTNWTSQTTGVSDSLLSIYFQNGNLGWACGTNGRIIATTNGGTNWFNQPSGTTVKLNDVKFGSASIGAIAGANGTRLVTSSGGAGWINNPELSQTELTRVCFTGVNQLFIGGDLGYVCANTVLTLIEPVNNNIPKEYSLKQNYPNPFNPATRIEFTLPQNEFAELVVFDITGKIIKTLVKEVLSAGNYNISYTAEGISSGVYFYRLSAGKFTQVNKMILIK